MYKFTAMINIKKLLLAVFMISCMIVPEVSAQEALKPRPSPLEMITMKYENTYIKITYGRPHKRGRNIFGDLLPYGEVWRTGANEATEITIEYLHKAQSAELVMMWDQTKVTIPIEFM